MPATGRSSNPGFQASRPDQLTGRSVFLSYRRLDDEPPPEFPDGDGFVRYFWRQLRWELDQLGVPNAILWGDRGKISPADGWSAIIREELRKADLFIAILSRNYVQSDWCNEEISTMAARIQMFESAARHRRIFRADKQHVPDDLVPEALREIQTVRFYDEDKETSQEQEFFWRGKVQRYDPYVKAIRELAYGIYQRLSELGIEMEPQAASPQRCPIKANGRVIFVAKPAHDILEEYKTLTYELTLSGYRIVPDVDKELPNIGEMALDVINTALAEAEVSIHLLGERTGGRPDGVETDIVSLQLANAASEAQKRSSFYRLIWAPKVLPQRSAALDCIPRDPFAVVDRFDRRLQSDQIDSDTAAKFNEFVFQRLKNKLATVAKTVYIHCALNDRDFALSIARELRRSGFTPYVRPGESEGNAQELVKAQETLINQSQHIVICWSIVSRATLIAELPAPTLVQLWKNRSPTKRLCLVIGPPKNASKDEVIELGICPDIDFVIDATRNDTSITTINTVLVPSLAGPPSRFGGLDHGLAA
jgi:TIR domain